MIVSKSYPRAAVIGNPSDGYFGKTVAFVFSNFCATVELTPSEKLKILPNKRDQLIYADINDLKNKINNNGYYGGIRLLKAAIKKFIDYCDNSNIKLPNKNFALKYNSNIPNRLGMAGSSAIITAAMKAIFQFYNLKIKKEELANLILAVEKEELIIGAGLQDRVAQVYEMPVYMDFNKKHMEEKRHGIYKKLNKNLFPNFYIAYRTDANEGSETVHNNLSERFDAGEKKTVGAMQQFAKLTDDFIFYLNKKNHKKLSELMDLNFDLRKSICTISKKNMEMINLARSIGASAKFTGSGGAVIGIYENEKMFKNLKEILTKNKINILKPDIIF